MKHSSHDVRRPQAPVSLRPLRAEDSRTLAELANSRAIWLMVRDIFPHPYTEKDARAFIEMASQSETATIYVIDYNGELAGVLGLHPQRDVYRHSMEIGYWLGERFWKKGIARAAVELALEIGFRKLGLQRIFACVFSNNAASMRVLERAGFTHEGTARAAVIKDGRILDECRFSILADEWERRIACRTGASGGGQ